MLLRLLWTNQEGTDAKLGLKMRVLASRSDAVNGAQWIYRAAAYGHDGRSHEPSWLCDHQHESAQIAFRCAMEWLDAKQSRTEAEGAA